jgi:hypothetical protein
MGWWDVKIRPFLFKIGQNSAAELSGRSTFYPAFLTHAAEQSASWQH